MDPTQYLQAAKYASSQGEDELSHNLCKSLINEHPSSPEADEARRLLEGGPDSDERGGNETPSQEGAASSGDSEFQQIGWSIAKWGVGLFGTSAVALALFGVIGLSLLVLIVLGDVSVIGSLDGFIFVGIAVCLFVGITIVMLIRNVARLLMAAVKRFFPSKGIKVLKVLKVLVVALPVMGIAVFYLNSILVKHFEDARVAALEYATYDDVVRGGHRDRNVHRASGRVRATGTPFTGMYREIRENGQLKSEANYVNGDADGLLREWHANGQLASEINFVDGDAHGLLREWHENGQLAREVNFVHGIARRLDVEWHEDGGLKDETCWGYTGVEHDLSWCR